MALSHYTLDIFTFNIITLYCMGFNQGTLIFNTLLFNTNCILFYILLCPFFNLLCIRLPALYGQYLINCFCTVYQKMSGLFLLQIFQIFQEYMWVWRDVSGNFCISIVHFKCDIYTLTQIFSGVPRIG